MRVFCSHSSYLTSLLSSRHPPCFVGTPEQVQQMMTEDTNGDDVMGIYHFIFSLTKLMPFFTSFVTLITLLTLPFAY